MAIKSYSCLLIFLLSTTIVVDSCSKLSSRNSRKSRLPKPSTNQSISVSQTTNSPSTLKYVPVMIRAKEMLIFPIKGINKRMLVRAYHPYDFITIPLRARICLIHEDIINFFSLLFNELTIFHAFLPPCIGNVKCVFNTAYSNSCHNSILCMTFLFANKEIISVDLGRQKL